MDDIIFEPQPVNSGGADDDATGGGIEGDLVPYVETQPRYEGFFADAEDSSCSVKVAIRIRPMIGIELRQNKGATCCTTTPELNKLQIGTKEFYFDKVFDQESS